VSYHKQLIYIAVFQTVVPWNGFPSPSSILESLKSTLLCFQEFFFSWAAGSSYKTRSQYEFYFFYSTADLADSKVAQINLTIIKQNGLTAKFGFEVP